MLLNVQNIGDKSSPDCVISGFHREVDEHCALLGYYAASNGNFFPTFRDNLSVPFRFFQIYSYKQRNGLASRNRKLIDCVITEGPTVFLRTAKFIVGFISVHKLSVFPATSMHSTPSHHIAFKIRFNIIISPMSVSPKRSIHVAFL